MKYDFASIEKRWQAYWDEHKSFAAEDYSDKPKFFCLVEFPYPSGDGLHVGHPRSYTALDIMARKKRMDGCNVLFPMGWDAFGLPTENFAIKNKIHPTKVTEKNIATFKRQLKMLGFSFDWDREVDTTDPGYYKWTQWIFLKFFEKGLAYKDTIPINWCISCKIGLANEEVVDGACERCGGEVEKRNKEQWMLKITEYAQRLIDDLDDVDFLDRIAKQQKHWIGRSEGARIDFAIDGHPGKTMRVFTTRADTLFGATYMVLSPEHELVADITTPGQKDAVNAYVRQAGLKSDLERTELAKEKTGVFTGAYAINPATDEKVPVWIADYVLSTYGTGAIMAVPGHDQRDWDFADAFNLPIKEVISGGDVTKAAYTDDGKLVNSGFITGMNVPEAIAAMKGWLKEKGIGEGEIQYKLRDWVFSRQRYWGEPIPIIKCDTCGYVPVPEDQLPVLLPDVENYEPTDTGESPLAKITDWVNTECPKCGAAAKRETDTMPNWAGSSWYFLRYIDPKNDTALADPEKLKYWMPVDLYNGGMEHTTLHLLYSRFWNKFLFDCGIVPTTEPYARRTSHGMILGEGGEKMSKSRGNVVNPDDVVSKYGSDVFRCYEMFIGPFDQTASWDTKGIEGINRFIQRVWRLVIDEDTGELSGRITDAPETDTGVLAVLHKTIEVVGGHIDEMRYNTSISQMMILVNELNKRESYSKATIVDLIKVLSPFAPHICEELWQKLGGTESTLKTGWPSFDPKYLVEDTVKIVVQVNGKVRANLQIPADTDRDGMQKLAMAEERIKELIDGKNVVKIIAVPKKLVNIVVK